MKRLIAFFTLLIMFSVSIADAQYFTWRQRLHATDCTALTDGKNTDLCYEADDQTLYKCVPNAGVNGTCTTPSEWKQSSSSGSSSGDITSVGDVTSGAAFTSVTPGKNLTFNNSTSGTVTLQTTTGALGTRTISLPAETGTICTSGSVCSGYQASGSYVAQSTTATIAGTSNEISSSAGAQDLSTNRTWTLSLPTSIDLGSKTSFEIPNGSAPTVDAFGEIAGDNNAWATGRGTVVVFDGTSETRVVNTLSSDTPTSGQVPKWNADGTITWENDIQDAGSATEWDNIGDPSTDTTIALTGLETHFTSTLDSSSKSIWTITNTDADTGADTSFIELRHNDGADANVFYLKAIGDNDGSPQTDYSFSQTAALIRPDLTVTGSITAGNLSGTNTGDQSEASIEAMVDLQDLQGAVIDSQVPNNITIDLASTVTVADAGGDTTTFPLLGVDATGSLGPRTDAGLTYQATTNALTATTFIGALIGNASTATNVIDTDFGDVTVSSGSWVVEDDSHSHTGATISGLDISDDTNLAGGTNGIDMSGDTINLDTTEVEATTWGAGGNASNVWSFNLSGTDTTLTFGSGLFTFAGGITATTGKHLTLGTTQWDNGSDKIDGEQIANGTIDDDSINFSDITGADLTLTDATTITASGKITANANLDIKNGATSSGVLAIFEDSDNGSNKATFQVPALASDTVYILPNTDGSANQVLSTDGSGTLDWVTASNGDITSVGDVTSGAAFDGTSGNTLIFEGSTADTNEITLVGANPGADFTITIPAKTGTLILNTDIDTSSEIASIVGDETGTGAIVFGTNPNLNIASGTILIPSSTSLPGACSVGQIYMDTNATTGQRLYACESTDTWVLQGGGSTSAGGSDGDVQYNNGSGGLAGESNFNYDSVTHTLTVDNLVVNSTGSSIDFEGATIDAYQTTLTVVDPTADRTITIPNVTGTLLTTNGVGTALTALDGENIQDDTIDDDSIDFADVTGADLTLTDATTITASGLITANANLNIANGATTAGTLKLLEDTDNGSNYTTFTVGAQSGNISYVFPTAQGSASTVLTNDGSGVLSWASASGSGDITDVGDVTSGAAFAGTQGNTLIFEGSTADTNEITLVGANPGADFTITIPAVTGTLVTTGDTGSITGTMVATNTLNFVDISDSLVLDNDLTVDQSTTTWVQTFNGTTTSGLTYTANSLTTGNGVYIASSATGLTGNLNRIELTGANTGNTGNVLKVGYTGTTGTAVALNVTNAGTGFTARFNDDGTYTDTTAVVIDASGKVGIGNTAPTVALDVTGAITASTTLTATTTMVIPTGTNPTVSGAGNIAEDTTASQLLYGSTPNVLSPVHTATFTVESLTASDDNYAFFLKNNPVTITGIGCNCRGTCSTLATFTLEDRGGNAMTITGTNPTCATTGAATFSAVTAGNQLTAGEAGAFDVTNTPTTGDTYLLSVTYTDDRQ